MTEHPEPGETFDEFRQRVRVPSEDKCTLYVLPIGSIPRKLTFFVRSYLKAFFMGIRLKLLPKKSLQKLNIESREMFGTTQYHANQILSKLNTPYDGYCMLAITLEDLYPGDEWNFVYGLSRGNRAIFSFARYGSMENEDSLFLRSMKVASHETGHMFGLRHCIYYNCLMNGSNHAEEASSKPCYLCPVCLRKLQYSLNFKFSERYAALVGVCDREARGFRRAGEWFERRAEELKNVRK